MTSIAVPCPSFMVNANRTHTISCQMQRWRNTNKLLASDNRSNRQPNHGRQRCRLRKFITNHFFIVPRSAQLVHVHDVIALCHRQSCWIGTECNTPNNIRIFAIVRIGRFCREFVTFFTIFVVQDYRSIRSGHCQTLLIQRPCNTTHTMRMILI